MITIRHDIERWTGAAISLINAYLLYKAITAMFPGSPAVAATARCSGSSPSSCSFAAPPFGG